MGRGKKRGSQKTTFCTTNRKAFPKVETKQVNKKSKLKSTNTENSVAVQEKTTAGCQDHKESPKDTIKKLEDEIESLHECIKTQKKEIKGMGIEIEALHDRYDSVKKNFEELQKVNDKERESLAINEEIIETLIKETDRKDDSEVSLKEAINSITEECSSLQNCKLSLEETLKIVMEELEKLQCNEVVLTESVDRCNEEIEREKESQMCIICLQIQSKVVFVPCGHLITCSNCSIQLTQCPMCRNAISSKVNVFRQ